tara:strand:- start:887 stop:1630 length:744 start_codon:yes stop_codon:yes gene_type:complete
VVYFGKNRIHCAEVDSTNEELKRIFSKKELENGTLLTTDFQTGGKGQMGSHWKSRHGKNFLGTFFLKPSVSGGEVFVLNMIVSLALRETVCEFLKGKVEIKWPNDIVVNGNKIAGVLIENKFSNSNLLGSFLGVGLNLNQKSFEKFQRAGTSIAKELGICVNKESVTSRLCFHIQQFYSLYQLKGYETVSYIYHQDLYLKGEEHAYKVGKDTRYLTLQYVNKKGDLQLFNQFGKLEEFTLKEIRFLL